MPLARKVSRAKWEPKEGLEDGELPADAVTADLRTQDNELSFWRCQDAEASSVERAALTIAAAGERLDKLDVVWVAEQELEDDELQLAQTAGRTPVKNMVDQHVDVQRLDYSRLGKVANRVAGALASKQHRRFTKKSVKKLLIAALEAEVLVLEDLDDKIRDEISKEHAKKSGK